MAELNQKECVHVGKVMDAHGIRGDLYILIFSGDVSWGSKLKQLALKRSDEQQSFDIQKVKSFKKGFIVKLAGFDDRNRAEEFKGAEVWVPEDLFVAQQGESLYLREVLNFTVKDEHLGPIGQVESFSSNGIQDLLVVQAADSSVYEIPFVEDFVVAIDYEQQTILMSLPEGLLEINRD
ncbi:ribosome maturation factor RimM [Pseudobdellovibrio exovorus]|uniref:Ribosome maturation factor RimM n=1 Tax=Pseudobdellovibrio exovorus JSS TaxID=1184267 RepID=M4V7X0_9BACT|nr:ribosome maturation factor RimM [Pseudobdellovibrio exovorus]AGH95472.1 putative 16S rRNA processing protein [Pseudobdellovibrio exovorus JSS]